nr:MAG TPA: hypothetical protein [Caudoviricetes sp.]
MSALRIDCRTRTFKSRSFKCIKINNRLTLIENLLANFLSGFSLKNNVATFTNAKFHKCFPPYKFLMNIFHPIFRLAIRFSSS